MDGRNAGSAVIGFVNGMCIFKIHFFYTNHIILPLSLSLSPSPSFVMFDAHTHRSENEKMETKHD